MKKIFAICAFLSFAALCLVSCTKPYQELKPSFPSFEEGKVSIKSGETVNAAFTLNDIRGNKTTATVEYSAAEQYDISVEFAADFASGNLVIKAPSLILNNTPFDVKVTFKDEVSGRLATSVLNVTPVLPESFKEYSVHANCFVAAPGAVLKFPIYKGNSDEKAAIDALNLGWQDNVGLLADIPVLNVNDGYAVIRLAEGKEGNAVINGVSGSTVVWSWHIWVCNDAPAEVAVAGKTFMDRNIGALNLDEKSELSVGVAYQYGRKDPFPCISFDVADKNGYKLRKIYDAQGQELTVPIAKNEESDNIENAIKNPATFYNNVYVSGAKHGYSWLTTDVTTYDINKFKSLWENGGKKSVYDPCPEGYKVAATADWNAVKEAAATPVEIWDNSFVTNDDSAIGTNEKYAAGNRKKVQFRGCIYNGLRLTITGEINSNSTAFSFANCVHKALPTAEVWTADIDPQFETATSASQKTSYFRGTAVKVNASGNGNYDDVSGIKVNALSTAGKYLLNYAIPTRCIKEN